MPLTPPSPDPGSGDDSPDLYAVVDGVPAYRGRRVTELVGTSFERVWGLLVDGPGSPGLPPAEPFNLPVRTGDVRADVLSALAQVAPVWGYRPLTDISQAQARENLARASVLALSFVAQSARGDQVPAVPQREIDLVSTVTERFLMRWRGHVDPVATDALNLFWLAVAEVGPVPSTRTARLAAEVGTDAASCLAAAVAVAGGPFGGGAAALGLELLTTVERTGDAAAAVADYLARHPRLPGFTTPVPGDVRTDLLRQACVDLHARRLAAADAVAAAGRAALGADSGPDLLFWGAVLLDHVGVPAELLSAMYICGRTAGWSAHVLDVHDRLAA